MPLRNPPQRISHPPPCGHRPNPADGRPPEPHNAGLITPRHHTDSGRVDPSAARPTARPSARVSARHHADPAEHGGAAPPPPDPKPVRWDNRRARS
ncbi:MULTISPECIES: hypothetical protein [unclassified Streptomyces]|uniref:hypothetical protein n=1 Tax=unclassified Streptomyces TaxID=2593676 RepID=UPI002E2E0E5E|nr:hypothetical protein [Streptomyces sp. NBC_00223]